MALIRVPRAPFDVVGVARTPPTQNEAPFRPPSLEVAAASAPARPDGTYVIAGLTLLIGGAVLGAVFAAFRSGPPFVPKPGVSVFAVFYIFAQSLERLLELIQIIIPSLGRTQAGEKKLSKDQAVEFRDQQLARAINQPSEATAAAVEAAGAQTAVDRIRANRALLGWTLASALAMIGSGLLGLKLIAAISEATPAPGWLDVAITGLVIGGGTKPLHDLIANLQESKKKKEDPSEAVGK